MKQHTPPSTPNRHRLAQWQAAHAQLLHDDPKYRSRHTAYLIAIVCLSIPLVAVYGYYFGIGFHSFALCLPIITSASLSILGLSLRQLHFMNRRIKTRLKQSTAI